MANTTSPSINRITTRGIAVTGLFTAVLCVLSQISIPTVPIPFTLSLFAIFLCGALLPPKLALLSVIAYLLLGTFGLPVFAGFKSGPQTLFGPTGGFLMAYPIMVLITSLSHTLFPKKKYLFFALPLGMLISLGICYVLGALWYSYSGKLDFFPTFTGFITSFALFDCVKIALAFLLSLVLRKILGRELAKLQ